jgi:putative glycosyltransferase (TIGR04372 family)
MRSALFHLARTLRDLRRGGVRVLLRKARRVPAVLGATAPVQVLRVVARAASVVGASLHGSVTARDRRWMVEQLSFLSERATDDRRDDAAAIVRQVRRDVAVGRISAAKAALEAAPPSLAGEPRILHELAQVHYLRGEFDRSIGLRVQEAALHDRTARESWLGALGVRFISGAYIGHIGHLALIDLLQRARILGELSPERRIFVGSADSVANRAYLECWRPHVDIRLLPRREYRTFEAAMRPLFDDVSIVRLASGPVDFYRAYAGVNERWRREGRTHLLTPDPERIERSRRSLAGVGLDPEGWFVGLHVREGDPHHWTNAVDCDPATYVPMIEEIVRAGGTVVRMGSPETTPLPRMKGLVDYAHLPVRSADNDVFVWSQCRFFVGTGSGPLNVPPTFGRPSIITNYPSIAFDQWFDRHMMLPKLVRDGRGNGVSFDRVLQSPFGWSVARRHEGSDWTFEDNSPTELADAAVEMLALTEGDRAFPQPTARQAAAADLLHGLGRRGRSPFPDSFIGRHPGLFPVA